MDRFPEYDMELEFGKYKLLCGVGCRALLISEEDRQLLMIGYMTDAEKGIRDEHALAEEILKGLGENAERISSLCSGFGGRYVCIARIGDRIIIWNDCCSLKQVFYDTDNTKDSICVASQARYIAFVKNYTKDSAAEAYLQKAQQEREFSLPLDATLYEKIKRLLPNHYLDNQGCFPARLRIFPETDDLRVLTDKERFDLLSGMLTNGMTSANSLFDLAVSLTGGLDSRAVLTAGSALKEKLTVVTLQYDGMPDTHTDLTIPARFCDRFCYDHHILKCSPPSPDYVKKYTEHSEHGHPYWMQMCQALSENGYSASLWVKGSCSEIVQNPCGNIPDRYVTPQLLCNLFELPEDDFSTSVIRRWIDRSRSAASESRIPLVSLFYWEHRMGSWLAECLNEGDIASECFSPFNVRAVLELLSTFPAVTRTAPDFRLFQRLMETFEPGSTDIPVNPGRYGSISARVKLFVKYYLPVVYRGLISVRRKQ